MPNFHDVLCEMRGMGINMAYFMEELTVNEFQRALEKTKTVIIPVGVVEQHGFHLPLSMDIITAVQVPKIAGDRLNALVALPVNYCYSGGELPGTINVSPQVFSLLIMDICSEFVRLGLKNIVILLGHGGEENTSALNSSLQVMLKRNPQYRSLTFSVIGAWELSKTWMDCFDMRPEWDSHAGMAETALLMHWKPEMVRGKIVMDESEIARKIRSEGWFSREEKRLDHKFVTPAYIQHEEIKVGISGFPEKASVELGEKISNEMVEGLIKYVDYLNENNR